MNANTSSAPQHGNDQVTPLAIQMLAEEYRKAADMLFEQRRNAGPLSLAPWRLLAIHAIELYLNAFLVRSGSEIKALRSMQHDFGERAKLAIAGGLELRKLTAAHLCSITAKREYVVSRYGPGTKEEVSEITRLTATLNEVGGKVSAAIAA